MKKTLAAAFLSLFILVFGVNVAYAENNSGSKSAKLSDIKKIETRKVEVKDKIASKSAELREKTLVRIKAMLTKIIARMYENQKRLDKNASKIATRLDKLKHKGVNTTAAEAKFDKARTAGLASKAAIDTAKAQVDALNGTSDIPASVKMSIEDAKKALFAYHKALVDATRELKAPRSLKEGTNSAN